MKSVKNLSKLNKGVLVVLVFALLVSFFAVFVYGRYTNSQRAQRTIAPYDYGGARFSSNYLGNVRNGENVKFLYVTNPLIRAAAVVTVCNYQQGKQTQTNVDDITYDVTVRLVKYDAESDPKYVPVDAAYISANSLTAYTVDVKKGDGSTITLGNTVVETSYEDCFLAAGAASSDAFSLRFSSNFNATETPPNLYVEMTAVPDNGSLPVLTGIFKTGLRAEGASNSWEGSFSDSTLYDPNDYDGLNYTISGTGRGTFTLKWDDTKVKLSDVSIRDLLSITGATRSGNSITFPVNSDVVDRYDLQFYKVNISGITWENMNVSLATAETALTTGISVGYNFLIS